MPAVLAEQRLHFPAESTTGAAAIIIDLPDGGRVSIGSGAAAALVTATLRALR